ncbi:MAG: HTTM domain-containing protein [Vicinamibacterales bacterium]
MSERWDRFWFDGVPPHIYALLRITLGLVGFLVLIRLGDAAFWDLDRGFISDVSLVGIKSSLRDAGLGTVAGWTLYGVSLLSFLMMTIGFRSSMAVPLALISQLVQLSWNSLPLSGAHPTLQSMLFCLMWADTGASWSVDAWLERRRKTGVPAEPQAAPEPEAVSIAPLRLLRYQIALIYLVTGLWKLGNPSWRDGSAVHYVLNTNVFHRFAGLLSPNLEWLAELGTYTTLAWELGFAFLLLWRPTRWLVLVLGVLMHLGIFATIEVGPFHFVMLAAYPAFLEPAFVARLFSRVTPLRSAGSPDPVIGAA